MQNKYVFYTKKAQNLRFGLLFAKIKRVFKPQLSQQELRH